MSESRESGAVFDGARWVFPADVINVSRQRLLDEFARISRLTEGGKWASYGTLAEFLHAVADNRLVSSRGFRADAEGYTNPWDELAAVIAEVATDEHPSA